MADAPIRVLLVDDDRQEYVLTEGILSIIVEGNYKLDWVGTYEEALTAISRREHDVYLIDYRLLGEKNGLDLLREAKRLGCKAPMILLTGLWDSAIDRQALREGAADYLVKGQFGPDILERSLRYSIERTRTLEALRDSEAKYREIAEGTNAILFSADLKGRLAYVNEAGGRLLGEAPDALLGRFCLRLVHPADRRQVSEAFRRQAENGIAANTLEFRCGKPPAEPKWLAASVRLQSDAAGKLCGLTGVAQDVTERQRLQSMFMQAEKLSAMGLLAAGIAHEINNPLTIILGHCDSALASLRKNETLSEHFKIIKRMAKRCGDIAHSLLAFSRKEEAPAGDFELGECVAAALSLVEPHARYKSVQVRRELRGEPLLVRGHKDQIEQVLINLANNAIDAMPEGGRLTLRTELIERGGRPWARIQVADTGQGIPKEHQKKIFEAFFTTKPAGVGTGLGLSLASEIVGKHGGEIEVASAPGKGSTFSVTLPVPDRGR